MHFPVLPTQQVESPQANRIFLPRWPENGCYLQGLRIGPLAGYTEKSDR
jgi:hypothetical protein